MPSSRRSHLIPISQALLVTFLWSTSWVLIKIGLREIPAISFAGLRYTLATLVLASVLVARPELRAEVRHLARADWLRLSLLGIVFYTLTQGAQFVALAFLPAVMLSLVLSFSPAAVGLLGVSFLGERLSRPQWGGVALFLVGVLFYFLPLSVPLSTLGLIAAGVGLLANSCGSILGRSVNRRADLHPLVVTVVSMGVGSLILLATGLTLEGMPRLDASGWAIVAWLAVVNTALAFTLWNHTLRRLTAIESSLINNTMLVQIAILAWIFLGEPIGGREAFGLLVALVGTILVQLPAARSASPEAPRSPPRRPDR